MSDAFHNKKRETLTSRRNFLKDAGSLALVTPILGSRAEASYRPIDGEKKLRMGIVGGGFGAAFPWYEHPNCEVTAVSDLREDRRKKLMDKFKCSNAYAEFHPMLKDPKVDAVAIFTGAPDHVPHCVDVMNAGKHSISAVPAAITLEQCQKLVDAVKKTGQTYMMAETSCFHAPTMTAREWRQQGKFGRIYYTEGDYLHNHGSDLIKGTASPQLMAMFVQDGKPTWRYGNAPGLYLTHASGPVIYVTGETFTEVAALGTPIDHEFYKKNQYNNPFINITFFFKTSGGNSSRIAIHWWTAAPGREGADYYGTEACFFEPRWGRPALVSYPNSKAQPYEVDNHSSILPPSMRKRVAEGHGGAEVFIVNEFVSACLERRKPLVDVNQAVAYTAPGICGQESAMKNGAWIKVPDFGPIG
ncbi:MAG: Gfo/Idh/MocA family oxidoreductase [Acidobacteria bacterium]|nr:Gfo/Idh/MocA family oxidoreductase [Acidobacteriota bacterium]